MSLPFLSFLFLLYFLALFLPSNLPSLLSSALPSFLSSTHLPFLPSFLTSFLASVPFFLSLPCRRTERLKRGEGVGRGRGTLISDPRVVGNAERRERYQGWRPDGIPGVSVLQKTNGVLSGDCPAGWRRLAVGLSDAIHRSNALR